MESNNLGNLASFYQEVDDIIGMYYDSTKGFALNYEQMVAAQQYFNRTASIAIEQMDETAMSYGNGVPTLPPDHPDTLAMILYSTTQAVHKANNTKGGKNYKVIGNLSICQVYSYWEDYYRAHVAKDLGILKNELRADIFGDIRLLRNSILHHRAVALPDIEKCRLTNWFRKGDCIVIDKEKFEFIMLHVKREINGIAQRLTES